MNNKFLLDQMPKSEEIVDLMTKRYPSMDPHTYFSYLVLRKVSVDLDNLLEALFQKANLSTGRFALLMILHSNQRGMMPSELAQLCGVTQATVSGLLSGLEKSELIVRKTHEADGRAYVIHLTDKGNQTMDQITPEYFNIVRKVFGSLDKSGQDQLAQLLMGVSLDIKKISESANSV